MGGGKRKERVQPLIVLLSYNPAGALLAFTSSRPLSVRCITALLPDPTPFSPHSPSPQSPSSHPRRRPLTPSPLHSPTHSPLLHNSSVWTAISHSRRAFPTFRIWPLVCVPCPFVPSIRTNPPVYGRTACPSFPNRSIRWGLSYGTPRGLVGSSSPDVYACVILTRPLANSTCRRYSNTF
jgi:hypothetical protein